MCESLNSPTWTICLYVIILGAPTPQLQWKLDYSSPDGYTNDTKSSSQNRALLLPGTSIKATANSTAKTMYFNGTNSGLLINNITSSCFANPGTCYSGLAISFWIMIVPSGNETNQGLILSSANINIAYKSNGTVFVTLWNGTREWGVMYNRNTSKGAWQCFTVTWNTTMLSFYIDGALKVRNGNVSSNMSQYTLAGRAVGKRVVFGNTARETADLKAIKMYLDELKIWNDTLRDFDGVCLTGRNFLS